MNNFQTRVEFIRNLPTQAPRFRRAKIEPTKPINLDSLWGECARWGSRLLKVSVSLGTCTALLYFVRIRYMPSDSLSSVVGLAGSIAMVSLGLFVGILALWGTPSIVFRTGIELVHDDIGPWFLKKRPSATNVVDAVSVSWWRTLLWCTATLGTPWFILFAWIAPQDVCGVNCSLVIEWLSGLFSAFVIGLFAFTSHNTAREDQTGKWTNLRPIGLRISFLATYVFFGVYPVIGLVTLASLSSYSKDPDPTYFLIGLAFGIAIMLLVNAMSIAFVLVGRKRLIFSGLAQFGVVAFSLILMLTVMAGWSTLQSRIMTLVSVRRPDVDMVINRPACQSLSALGIKTLMATAKTQGSAEYCILRNVTILSGIGTRWPISCSDDEGRKLLLNSSDVITVTAADLTDRSVVDLPFAEISFCRTRS